MQRFSATRDMVDGQEIVVLADREGLAQVRVARSGSLLVGFDVTLADGRTHNLADGYRSGAEIREHSASRFAIMAPFAGRIGDARYRWHGKDYDLSPRVMTDRGIRHGFVRGTEFDLGRLDADGEQASATLVTTIAPHPGYPWTINFGVSWTLAQDGLTLEARMRNAGDSIAPCFFGWHPYFKLGGDRADRWELEIPAQTLVRTDRNMIALPGKDAYVALDDAPELDFRQPRPVGELVIDQCYTDLRAEADGRIRTRLRDPSSGLGVAVWQERGVMHAFTGDTVSRPRQSVALEPMECMANAFNREDCAETIGLLPGRERNFRCGVQVLRR